MKKVLLIGLGGTGCTVVSKVKRMVEEVQTKRGKDPSITIRFLGFDTDENQKDAPGLDIVRTSRDSSVNNLLRSEPGYEEWFPYHPALLARNILKGAGQFRILSRLAFSDTMRHPKMLKKLDNALKSLNSEEGEESDTLKIMIVSSFAGGTGAGMFLQMPLFLRSYIDKHYPGSQVLIRGLFALPDVFMNHPFSDTQRESMYANAYASLKELSAINKICLSSDDEMCKYDLKIGGLFDSKKILADEKSRSLSKKPKAARKPYDFIFFMDNVNLNRNTLDGPDSVYQEEMAKITYMQVFAPLVDTTDSREDNLIANTMIDDGETMYGSAGSAKMVYPYEDILDYCAYRKVKDVVNNEWRFVDDYCLELLKNQKAQQKTDPSIKVQSYSETFIAKVDDLIKSKSPAFTFLPQDVADVIIDEATEIPIRIERQESLYEKAIRFIDKSYDEDSVLTALRLQAEQKGNTEQNADMDQEGVRKAISRKEMRLNNYYSGIIDRVSMRATSIANSIIPQVLNGPDDDVRNSYNIRNMLEKTSENKRHAIHPLSARYLLYKLLVKLKKEKDEAAKKVRSNEAAIQKYWDEDRNKKTKDIQEKWYDIVPKIGLSRRNFVKLYNNESNKQLNRLKAYGKMQMRLAVINVLIDRIEEILDRYEKIFNTLGHVSEEMKIRSEVIENRYAEDGISEMYLCVNPDLLKMIYDNLLPINDEGEEKDIYDSLFSEVYCYAMENLARKAQRRNQSEKDDTTAMKQLIGESVKDMFCARILPYYKEQLRDKCNDDLNLTVFDALEKQARYNAAPVVGGERVIKLAKKENIDKARRELLTKICRMAAPYLLCEEYHEPDPELKNDDGISDMLNPLYWGMSDEVHKRIVATQGDPIKYMTPEDSFDPELDTSVMYSDYELCCYRALYNIRLSEIPKFQESDDTEYQGDFYKNYAARIQKMQQGRYGKTIEGITPHLDKRWHTRQYLPMISGAKDNDDDKLAAKAMWLAYFTKNIRNTPSKKGYWVFFMPYQKNSRIRKNSNYKERQLQYNGEPITRLDAVYDVFKAFQQDSLMISQTIEVLEPVLEQNAEQIASATVFDMVGPRGIPLTDAMIGLTSQESKTLLSMLNENGDKEVDQYTADASFNTNALTLMNCVIRHRTASEDEKRIIMEALWEIIEKLGNGMGDRHEEFLMRIFANSPYIKKVNRPLANEIVIEPYFYETMDRYDRFYAINSKPATTKAKGTEKKTPAKKTTAKSANAGKGTTKATATKTSTRAAGKKSPAKKTTRKSTTKNP